MATKTICDICGIKVNEDSREDKGKYYDIEYQGEDYSVLVSILGRKDKIDVCDLCVHKIVKKLANSI